ncbi:MAG: c-type cytochrome [Mangrovicoccus sp.]
MKRLLCVTSICLFSSSLSLSAQPLDGLVTVDRLPMPTHSVLQTGREIWGGLCINCHGAKTPAGAPKITDTRKWKKRIAQGLPVLFSHALNGFYGPSFAEMPARGGDPDLSDDQVRAAVAYMVYHSGGSEIVDAWLNDGQVPLD